LQYDPARWYIAVPRILQLVALRFGSSHDKDLAIVVLRHEVAILRGQIARPAFTTADRAFLAAVSRLLARVKWTSFIVTPATLVRWHRRFVARRRTYPRRIGRPATARDVRALVLRSATENPRRGCQRIVGELKGLGVLRQYRVRGKMIDVGVAARHSTGDAGRLQDGCCISISPGDA